MYIEQRPPRPNDLKVDQFDHPEYLYGIRLQKFSLRRCTFRGSNLSPTSVLSLAISIPP